MIDEFNVSDPARHLLTVQPRHENTQWETMRHVEGLSVHFIGHHHTRLRDPVKRDTCRIAVSGLESSMGRRRFHFDLFEDFLNIEALPLQKADQITAEWIAD